MLTIDYSYPTTYGELYGFLNPMAAKERNHE
ncbi:MAG: hypothetical protein ACI8TX_000720 [Hyphomicrobiaceae bacterium]|jgi:hypothetical protein